MDLEEKMDNFTPIIEMYSQDSCAPVENYYHINLPTGCIKNVRD